MKRSATANQIPPSRPLRLGVLISGGGRTLQNIAEAIAAGKLDATVACVISSRADAYGIERARRLDLPVEVVSRKDYRNATEFSDAVWGHLHRAKVHLVCLAGFLSLLEIPANFVNRVVNIHPALLPAFGGRHMYGHHVHEAVLAAGCKVSGCTVHFCDDTYDTGPILVQRTCPVLEDDTPDTLAARVFEQEGAAYIAALQLIAADRVRIEGRRARILPECPEEG